MTRTPPLPSPGATPARRFARSAGRVALRAAASLPLLWCFGAIHYDGPLPGAGNVVLAVIWLALALGLLFRARSVRDRWLSYAGALALVLLPWSFKRPSNDRDWAPEYSRTPSATIDGDAVTLVNFRNFDYAPDGTATERWETRTVHLSKLRGIDCFLTYWGVPLIGHPIFSFDFGEEGRVAFSIETRRERGETYTTVGGLYKLYELIYLPGDERDFVRHRTNLREDEDTYLFRLSIGPEKSRARFLEYIENIRQMEQRPRFYNVITANCTTALRAQIETADQGPFDWRLVANGKLDELLDERDLLVTGGLPLAELKKRSLIDPRAQECHDDPAFSERIREGLPGFSR